MAESRLERLAKYVNVDVNSQNFVGKRENTKVIELLSAQLKTDSNFVEVSQWVSLSQNLSSDDLAHLDAILISQNYIVGNKLSTADVVIFDAILNSDKGLLAASASQKNVTRWIENVSVQLNAPSILNVRAPTLLPFISPFASAPVPAEAPAAVKTEAKKEAKEAPSSSAPQKEGKEGKKANKEGKAAEKESKAAEKSAPAAVESKEEELDPSKLDIRVGIVRKCWNHPESEKLLCEEVDIGEENVRRIGSGLRHFYKAEDFEGRKVLVLANLKERSLGGFPSHGMVLCTANADHTQVVLLEPPAGSKPGDRVVFEGFSGEPAPAAQVAKKKLLEKLAPDLKTNEAGVACWRASRWTVGSENCISTMANSNIS